MSKAGILKQYSQRLGAVAAAGDAREESFYSALEELLASVAAATGRTRVHVTTLPKQTDAGNPDFRVWNGSDRITGYIEAKNPAQTDLDVIESSDQLRRYRDTFPNLLLTNFTEFRLYRNGQHVETLRAASPNILNDFRMAPPIERPGELWALLDRFLDFAVPQAPTAEELAVQLAKRTRFLRQVLAQQLAQGDQPAGRELSGFYEAFQKFLIADLTHDEFADLYAQTITYGLFAARTRSRGGFTRRTALDRIPYTIGVLHDVFRFISLADLPAQLEWIVDDIAEVLDVADARDILDRYYHEHKGGDPIVHFYETFLAQYDPEQRERRGVYYTPEPVVSYIVRSIHQLLKSEFAMADGLADEGVTLLDPAAGTMTFVARAAQEAVKEFTARYGATAREEFIRRHVLGHFYAFELMMAPYAVGHLKMAFFLEELGHRLTDEERVKLYLTNALDMEELAQTDMPFYRALADESQEAGKVKRKQKILVILGNPPYSGHSANLSERPVRIAAGRPYTVGWVADADGRAKPVERIAKHDMEGVVQPTFIGARLRDYFFVDGKPLDEKNPKWLHDDYVKFLRFAQWKIEQAGRGIVGMITNHSYLDNPTFRGMRQSLANTFDDIYVLDLHGNALKRETCPDGSPDVNVFDIRQGVAIAFFVKRGRKKKVPAEVRHADLWGTRPGKFDWLDKNNFTTTPWRRLEPRSPSRLFVPRDERSQAAFESFPSLPDLFPANSVGIVTARDGLTVHWSDEDAWRTVTVFSGMEPELARRGYKLGKDARDWKVTLAQKDLLDSGPHRENVAPILYRPFDTRFTYYTGRSRGFLCMPRPEIMRHMLQENLGLCVGRAGQVVGAETWDLCFCTSRLTDFNLFYRGGNAIFPLYLYPNGERDLFAAAEPSERSPNLNPKLLPALKAVYGHRPSPEQVLHYVYGVLYAPVYRLRYAEFLRSDFPRVPFTADAKLFHQVAELGRRLTELHLLCSAELDWPVARLEGEGGDLRIAKGSKAGVRFSPDEQRLYINKSQFFAPVSQALWDYRVGGYQVAEKWLKDRAQRGSLCPFEVRAFCRTLTALHLTMEIQERLGELYQKIEQSLLGGLAHL